MANKSYKESSVKTVADSIRDKLSEDTPTSEKFKIGEMGEAVRNIKSYEYYRDKFIIDNAGAIRFSKGWISSIDQDEEHPCVYEIIDADNGILHAFTRSIILKAALCVDPDDHTKFRITRIFFDGGNGQQLIGSTATIIQNGVQIPHFIAEQDDVFSIHDSETYNAVYTSETAPAMVGQTSYVMGEAERLFLNRKIKVTGIDEELSFSILTNLFKDGNEISLKEIFNMKFTVEDIDFKWKLPTNLQFSHPSWVENPLPVYYYPTVSPSTFITIRNDGVKFVVGCTMTGVGPLYTRKYNKKIPMGVFPDYTLEMTEESEYFLSVGSFTLSGDYAREPYEPADYTITSNPQTIGPCGDDHDNPGYKEVDTKIYNCISDNNGYFYILTNPDSTASAFDSNGYSTFLWNNTLQNLVLKTYSGFSKVPSETLRLPIDLHHRFIGYGG